MNTIFLDGVQNPYPEFAKVDMKSARIHKELKVKLLQVWNYSEIIPKTKHPNFYVVNNSQFVNDTLNNNSLVNHIENFMPDTEKELIIDLEQKT